MFGLKNKAHEMYRGIVSSLKETNKKSKFIEKGTLTPQEFVEAGDKLVQINPMWEWVEAETDKLRNKDLPKEKQMLTAEIKSWQRMNDINMDDYLDVKELNDEWTDFDLKDKVVEDLTSKVEQKEEKKEKPVEEEEEILDLEDMLDDDDEDNTEPKEEPAEKKEVNKEMRDYRVYITYDTYYDTPKFWLSGVDYKGDILTKEQIFEEIMSEYKDKTVSLENHPHLGRQMICIHPCKHAEVVKTLVHKAIENGKDIKVNQYLFIFLKFISSVMPGLELDYTTEIEF